MTDSEKKHDISEILESYDLPDPQSFITKVDKSNRVKFITRFESYLDQLSESEKRRYLAAFINAFDAIDERDKLKKFTTSVGTDYSVRISKFKEKHGRKPYKREKDEIYDAAKNAVVQHSDAYRKMRKRVLELFEKLSDKNHLKNDNEQNLDQSREEMKRGNPSPTPNELTKKMKEEGESNEWLKGLIQKAGRKIIKRSNKSASELFHSSCWPQKELWSAVIDMNPKFKEIKKTTFRSWLKKAYEDGEYDSL